MASVLDDKGVGYLSHCGQFCTVLLERLRRGRATFFLYLAPLSALLILSVVLEALIYPKSFSEVK